MLMLSIFRTIMFLLIIACVILVAYCLIIKDKEWVLFLLLTIPCGLLIFLINISITNAINTYSNSDSFKQELDSMIYTISAIESQELSNERINNIKNEIYDYNTRLRTILIETKECASDHVNDYDEYYYLDYDYVTNRVVKQTILPKDTI